MATEDIHRRLHDAPGFDRLAEGSIGLRDYAALLVRLHRLHVPLEQRLLESAHLRFWGIDMRRRQRAHLLAADLADLGAAPDLARPARYPESAGAGWDFGLLYVREGSTLGGRELARRLDGLLPAGLPAGRRFLSGPPDSGLLWKECRAALETYAAETGDLAGMVAGARAAFETFAGVLFEDA